MSKVYCEVVDDVKGFMFRIVAECDVPGSGGITARHEGKWHVDYTSFATLNAPTGLNGGHMEAWMAGTAYWCGKDGKGEMFNELVPFKVSSNPNAIDPVTIERPDTHADGAPIKPKFEPTQLRTDNYCVACSAEHHDTCSMTPGCPCCDQNLAVQMFYVCRHRKRGCSLCK